MLQDMQEASLFGDELKNTVKHNDTARKETDEIKEKSIPEINYDELTDEQAKIVKLLEKGTLLADEIAVLAEIDVTEVLTILTELELFGIIEAQAGNRYSL